MRWDTPGYPNCNLAKVGVESSNLFARSNFPLKIEAITAVLRDCRVLTSIHQARV